MRDKPHLAGGRRPNVRVPSCFWGVYPAHTDIFCIIFYRILVTSGQTLDDMYKYLETNDRLAMATRTLDWRHMAPTAPDTLWCHPYPTQDPFILTATPHLYVIGNQPSFATTLVTSALATDQSHVSASPMTAGSRKRGREEDTVSDGQVRCRMVLLPKFSETATLVLVHTGTLECKTIQVGVDTRLFPQ